MKIKVVNQSAKLMDIANPLKKIEKCARVCYQSFDKEGEGSDLKLCQHLKQRGHLAMFEHYRIYVRTDHHTTLKDVELEDFKYVDFIEDNTLDTVLSINLRTLSEWFEDERFVMLARCIVAHIPALEELFPKGDLNLDIYGAIEILGPHEVPLKWRYFTFDITTNRGITHELVRHRKGSFAQESTRYCAYRDELRIVFDEPVDNSLDKYVINDIVQQSIYQDVLHVLDGYSDLLESGVSPQIARGILPNVTAAQIVMTMRYDWWQYFLGLRESSAAHPTVQALATMIREQLDGLTTTD